MNAALGLLGKLFAFPRHIYAFLISDTSFLSGFLVLNTSDIRLVSLSAFYYVISSGYFEISMRNNQTTVLFYVHFLTKIHRIIWHS